LAVPGVDVICLEQIREGFAFEESRVALAMPDGEIVRNPVADLTASAAYISRWLAAKLRSEGADVIFFF
jgi:hypothetical protein